MAGDETHYIRQRPVFAGRNGQPGWEMKLRLISQRADPAPARGAGDETADIRYRYVLLLSRAGSLPQV